MRPRQSTKCKAAKCQFAKKPSMLFVCFKKRVGDFAPSQFITTLYTLAKAALNSPAVCP